MNAVSVLKLLDGLLTLVEVGSLAYLKMQESRARLKVIMDEDRDPTEDEWADLFSNIDAAHETIQNS